MAHTSHLGLLGLAALALLPHTAVAKKSSLPPLSSFLTPPYSELNYGDFPEIAQNQEKIPVLAPGQTVAFYLTRGGEMLSAYCSEPTTQTVHQPEHEINLPHYALSSFVEPDRFQSDIESLSITSGFESTKANSTVEGLHTESEDAVAKVSSTVSASEMNSNLGEENVSVEALSAQRDDNFDTEQGEITVDDTSGIESSIGSQSEDKTLGQEETEENIVGTQAGSYQKGSAESSSGQGSERAKQLELQASLLGGISGLLDTNDLSAIWDTRIGYGLLDESDELNSYEFSDDLIGIFADATQEFLDLFARWDDLTLADLLTGLTSEKIRRDAPLDGAEPSYDVELHCGTKNANTGDKIYFGGLFGMQTELVNRGAPIYEVLILSAPPADSAFYAKPEEGVGYLTEYKQQDNVVVTRVFHAIESGWTFRSLYATKAEPWVAAPG